MAKETAQKTTTTNKSTSIARKSAKVRTTENVIPDGCILPTLEFHAGSACGRVELFYPMNPFAINLLSVMHEKRSSYTEPQVKGLKAMGFEIKMIHKERDWL